MGGVQGGSVAASRGRRSMFAGIALVLGVPLFGMAAWAAPGASAASASNISIDQTERGDGSGPCAMAWDSLRYEIDNDDEAFVLRVLTDVRLCQPIVAAAVVYGMPGNGSAWPQQLLERREFVLQPAGSTEIRFDKTCTAAQFDVIVGASPQTINPLGQWHGPLLFPGDVRTAFQHWGSADCGPGGTTSTLPPVTQPTVPTEPTIPTEPTVPTSPEGPGPDVAPGTSGPGRSGTAPTEVLGATTTSVPSSPTTAPPAAPADSVLGASQSPSVAGLALTGTSVTVMVVMGCLLILSGVAIVVFPRPRRHWGR